MDVDSEGLARDSVGAQQKRRRTESESSTSAESLRSTRTLQSEDVHVIHENGRVYGNDSYCMPCDPGEQDRLAILHQVFTLALRGMYTTVNINSSTRHILDLGTGPGNWAVAMAQRYPRAEVTGIDMAVWDVEMAEAADANQGLVRWEIDDLDVWGVEGDYDELNARLQRHDFTNDLPNRRPPASPTKQSRETSLDLPMRDSYVQQPASASDSVSSLFVLEPEEELGWHFSDTYDLIHLRGMNGVFANWEGVYDEIFGSLNPGGHVEIADWDVDLPSLESTHESPFPFRALAGLYLSGVQASFKSGRPIGTFYMHHTFLEDAGFTDIRTTQVNVPIGTWHESEEQRKIGKLFLVALLESFESMLLRLLTQWGDAQKTWTAEEVKSEIEVAKGEILGWTRREEQELRTGGASRQGWCASFKWITGRKALHAGR